MKDLHLISTSIFSTYANCTNDSLFEGNLIKELKNVENNFYKIMSIEENLIEEYNDHGMNQLMEDESPLQMFDLVL